MMPTCLLLIVWFLLCIPGSLHLVRAQNLTRAITDPDEAEALNSIFAAWKILRLREWNTSSELCSGPAIDDNIKIDDPAYNPFIKCDCTFNSSTICRITALKVFGKDAVGPIPPQLWTLIYLENLNLAQNYLTGSISPAIGNLTRMEWLTFGINALSGPFPKEIGLLTNLKSLGFGVNKFSGSIPPEIGNCTKLMKIYLGNFELKGGLPSSFANLVELEDLWIVDLDVTGRIPDFIGSWTKLLTMRIHGTGWSGPIPSSFSNLTSLNELRLGDISNGSSSLDFIKDMKSLRILVLRNNNLTGTIPSNIGEFSNLEQVDLSFNQLHGPIPASLFNLNQLTYLFLGNNTLNGSLPTQKSQGLSDIDVSYNDLSGSLPPWVSLPNLKLNLVANNFTLKGHDKRILQGLKCLQKNFPCNRGKGIYSEFSINSGGPEMRSNGEVFEKEDEDLGTASFFVSDVQRWAVSSVGYYSARRNNVWIINTLNAELYKSARHSSSSLRYYGLGLENGGYTVTLQFAEIIITDSYSWKDFRPTVGNMPPSKEKYSTGTIVGVIVGLGLVSIIAGVAIFMIRKRNKRYTDDAELLSMDIKPYTFSYSELKNATQDFNPSSKLGEGGFGSVYKGKLNDGREIAVKVLSVGSQHGKGQFVAEIVAISAVMHRNLVQLYGCCYEGDHRLLVYEYLPNGSLDQALFGGGKTLYLDWSTRFEICMGVARGLAYLHEEASVRIVHRDVKAGNILLDFSLVPKVSDFGLAKLYDDKKTHISTRVAGTIGYLAPEYAMRGHLTEKADVYAFGIVALELVSGRKNTNVNLDNEKKYLLQWAWNLHQDGREAELIDQELAEFNMEEVKRVIGIALLCTYSSHSLRPPMSRVVAMLSGDVEVSKITSQLGYLTDWRFDESSSSSFSAFQTKDTGASGSFSTGFVTPKDGNFKQLGVKIKEGR
ncbi:unnamed protein product [Brassica rapa]|uniref:non-specific serine/threonine protein kinase n=1 Tax=Brassica campestris TaxID=3711 RepID=A0A8D9DD40_BRACM|nr:unnamed protein product [Brassica rapa]